MTRISFIIENNVVFFVELVFFFFNKAFRISSSRFVSPDSRPWIPYPVLVSLTPSQPFLSRHAILLPMYDVGKER